MEISPLIFIVIFLLYDIIITALIVSAIKNKNKGNKND